MGSKIGSVGKLLTGLLAAALLLTACGGGAASKPASSSSAGAASSASGAPETKTITLGLAIQAADYVPLWLAESQGIFKKNGINVKLVTFHGDAGLSKALISGSATVGLGSLIGLTHAIKKDPNLQAFWGGYNATQFSWWTPKGITSWSQLKGKTAGISSFGSETDFLTEYLLQLHGLTPNKDVKMLPVGSSANELAALRAGTIQFAILSYPTSFEAHDAGYHEIAKETDFLPQWPNHVFSANKSFLTKNPNTVKALLSANAEAIKLVQSNPKLAEQAIEQHLHVQKQYLAPTMNGYLPTYNADGRLPNAKSMDTFWKMGVQFHVYKSPWPESRWLNTTFLNSYQSWLK